MSRFIFFIMIILCGGLMQAAQNTNPGERLAHYKKLEMWAEGQRRCSTWLSATSLVTGYCTLQEVARLHGGQQVGALCNSQKDYVTLFGIWTAASLITAACLFFNSRRMLSLAKERTPQRLAPTTVFHAQTIECLQEARASTDV